MHTFSSIFNVFQPQKKRLAWLFLILICPLLCMFSSCKKSIDYSAYVSELRNNIFLAETEDLSLRIFSVYKESPYIADGIPRERTMRTEVYLTAPEGDEPCHITFVCNEKTYGGDMSFDNVKNEYYFSCTLDTSKESALNCHIQYGEIQTDITAFSVRTDNVLSHENILTMLYAEEKDLFDSLTDEYGFAGEIYLRLIYEEAPYYYVGIIDRTGSVNAFLINATTGKILASRKT